MCGRLVIEALQHVDCSAVDMAVEQTREVLLVINAFFAT